MLLRLTPIFARQKPARATVLGRLNHHAQDQTRGQDRSIGLRKDVINLYKNLIYLSREWPTDLRPQIKNAFMKNKDVTDVDEIRKLIAWGEYISKEIIATYYLRKYRSLKRRYPENDSRHLQENTKSFNLSESV